MSLMEFHWNGCFDVKLLERINCLGNYIYIYILHAFDDCCGMFHDGYDDNGKQILIKYKLTDDTVNKLLNILNKEY